MKRTTIIALLCGLAPTTALAAAHATLRPTTLAVGTPAELSITVDGTAAAPPAPNIAGADVRPSGQMSQTQIVNGASTQQTTYVFSVVPSRTGPLDIPAIRVGADTTEPLHATVGANPVPQAAAAPASAPPPAAGAERAEPTHAFITLDVPAKSLVVGQAVPIAIRAYFRGGTSASLEGNPHLTSDAFTLSGLSDKPAQTQVELHGEPYLQATWTGILSPAKPSAGKLGVELPVELAYRSAPRPAQHHSMRDAFGGDPFGDMFGGADPFANMPDPFGDLDTMFDIGPMRQYRTTLRATAGMLTVADLPTAGRPAGFTGAVGRFAIAVDPIAGQPRVGEPVTLTVHVTGTGNFERVALAGATDTTDLRAYSIKSAFAPVAGKPLAGEKTFTQTIVPTRPGDVAIAPLALAYFDPAKHAYATAQTEATTLHVAAAPGGVAAAAAPVASHARIDTGGARATLEPLIRGTGLWIGLAVLVGGTAILVLAAWTRRSPRIVHVLRARRLDRAIARTFAEMDRAARSGDRPAFFTAARQALQARLAERWHTTPEAITAHDVATRLGEGGAPIRAVFEQADGVAYGGAVSPEPLDHWQHVVRDELASLEAAS